jgi:hypothetical protein
LIEFERFRPEHIEGFQVQPAQYELQTHLGYPGYAEAIQGPYTWTGLIDGSVVGFAGIQIKWEGRGLGWAMLSTHLTARDFLRAHNKVREILDVAQMRLRRIETAVRSDYEEGHRWAKALGFSPEGTMRKFTPNGYDAVLYARVA